MRNPIQDDLLPVQAALDIVLGHALTLGEEEVPLLQAAGRVLAEALIADRPFPPFDRVTMDGIAIRFDAFAAGRRCFTVAGTQAAGQPPLHLDSAEHCLEIMTGAVLPVGADTVVRYEDVHFEGDQVTIMVSDIQRSQSIHLKGSDRAAGEVIVSAGQIISAGEIGVAATIGKTTLRVKRLPRVVVISTGDELVRIQDTPLPHQIRSSNIFALSAALQQMGLSPEQRHFPDDPVKMREGLKMCLQTFDAVVLAGGVSEGAFDFVPGVLTELGVQKCFHRVQQRPGNLSGLAIGKGSVPSLLYPEILLLPSWGFRNMLNLGCVKRLDFLLPWLHSQH